ncbi:MAG: DUF134 domain-containing protein [Eggerthellaceae bacterium]|jgi:predicted DNA-binding protein (UPF0251 family)/predicted Fe-Mo cluster-binding NifX family protein
MAGRNSRTRQIGIVPEYTGFIPEGIPTGTVVVLTYDELETIRLLDLEKLSQEEAAARMGVARTTVTGIYERAREKVADSLVNGKTLLIEGGNVCFPTCTGRRFSHASSPKRSEEIMRVAVAYDDGTIFPHFGRTQTFKLYDIENGAVASTQVADTQGAGHGALVDFLKQNGVDVLVCGGIGGGAQDRLASQGIDLYGGISGSADQAVAAFIAGTLEKSEIVECGHHHHGHDGCGHHDHGHAEGDCHHGHHGGERGCGGHHGHAEGGRCCHKQ